MGNIYVPNAIQVTLIHETCCNCATNFAMDNNLKQRLKETGDTFYCPNGHAQRYTETEATRLKRQNQSLESNLRWAKIDAQNAKYSHAATKGKLTKLKNRIANGVCPCCNRTFANISRHMAGQHPDYLQVDHE